MTGPLEELKLLYEAGTKGPLTLIRYEHGGGRLYKEEPRTLVADFFDESDRELFVATHRALPALLAVAQAAVRADSVRHAGYAGAMEDYAKAMDDIRTALASLTTNERKEQ